MSVLLQLINIVYMGHSKESQPFIIQNYSIVYMGHSFCQEPEKFSQVQRSS